MVVNTKDLVFLVADKDMEEGIRGLLTRPMALGISQHVDFDIYVHPDHDSGCYIGADDFLRFAIKSYAHAIVMFDREGCGSQHQPQKIGLEVEARLTINGWSGRCAAIVLEPELETWVWSNSPNVDEVLGWKNKQPPLREWLRLQRFMKEPEYKPKRPKEAMQEALKQVHKARSPYIFRRLAEQVSLQGHDEPAFVKLRNTLRQWFPPE